MTPTNRLLQSLSSENRNLLLSHCTALRMPARMSCYHAYQRPKYVYFLTSGMVSLVTYMPEGSSAEVGIIGLEGLVGGFHLIGPSTVTNDAFVQLAGDGLRISFVEMQRIFRSSEEIRDRILEFVQQQSLNTTQIAACNRLHTADERLARWLLMAQDRTQSATLELTQEFLGMMLGARRTTVAITAGDLQKAGLIHYRRGRVTILDRAGLITAACSCYQVTAELLGGLYGGSLAQTSHPPSRPSNIERIHREPPPSRQKNEFFTDQ